MKTFLFTAFLVCSIMGLKAQILTQMNQNTDSIVIGKVLEEDYFQGIYEGNVNRLGKLYHPGTLLFGDVKGQPYARDLAQYLDAVATRQSPKDSGLPFKGEIISVDVINSIAMAKVHVKMYSFNYDEFLSFHKIEGKWLIVNKMISDIHP